MNLERLAENLDRLPPGKKREVLSLLEKREQLIRCNRIDTFYPEEGPLRRELYPKHTALMAAGKTCRERAAIAANQVGKSEGIGAYEMALHLSGEYPPWWAGKRFHRPVLAWAGGKTNFTVRDNAQTKLLGKPGHLGTGMVRAGLLKGPVKRPGVPDGIESFQVRHVSGGWSTCVLKSYEQGWETWAGPVVEAVWFDEEPPMAVYQEGLMRTINSGGIVLATFTPKEGWTEVVQSYFENGTEIQPGDEVSGKAWVGIAWDDVPHLTESAKADMLRGAPRYLHDAISRGIPTVGSGLVLPVDDELITCKPFPIPRHFPRIGGIDFGIDHPTAFALIAWDRDADVCYVTHVYRRTDALPLVHASAIKALCPWVPIAWPHDGLVRDKGSGIQLKKHYQGHGLNLLPRHFENPEGGNGVEAGVTEMLERMETGRLKIFETCREFFEEKRTYHRKDGQIVSVRDDVISATRYALMSRRFAKTPPAPAASRRPSWRPADPVGGY